MVYGKDQHLFIQASSDMMHSLTFRKKRTVIPKIPRGYSGRFPLSIFVKNSLGGFEPNALFYWAVKVLNFTEHGVVGATSYAPCPDHINK